MKDNGGEMKENGGKWRKNERNLKKLKEHGGKSRKWRKQKDTNQPDKTNKNHKKMHAPDIVMGPIWDPN